MPADDADLVPLLDAILDTVPAPVCDVDAPLQALVTNLDASEYLGRLAIGRVMAGVLRKGEQVAVLPARISRRPGHRVRRRMSQLYAFHGIGREEVAEVSAGDLFIVAGIPEVEVGDTLASLENPVALQRLTVDEPVLRMSFGVNTSPVAGTRRQVRHEPPPARAARPRDPRQRVDPPGGHRLARRPRGRRPG